MLNNWYKKEKPFGGFAGFGGGATGLTFGGSAGFSATGGTVSTDGDYTFHHFTFPNSDNFEVTGNGTTEMDIWVVGGGGGSAAGSPNGGYGGGGGGGGGVAYNRLSVAEGTYTVTVGDGGTGGTNNTNGGNATSGGPSTFGPGSSIPFTANGGGAGRNNSVTGVSGGSGGGTGSSPSNYNKEGGGVVMSSSPPGGHNFGNPAGYSVAPADPFMGGGGGGAISQGGYGGTGNLWPLLPESGGGGFGVGRSRGLSWIPASFGSSGDFGGGGGAGGWSDTGPGNTQGTIGGNNGGGSGRHGTPVLDNTAGADNSGGGGGGGQSGPQPGKDGGSGAVLIRYRTNGGSIDNAPATFASVSSPNPVSIGNVDYHVFTGPGTLTVNSPGRIYYLVIGGGGGGGTNGGGGGAGGLKCNHPTAPALYRDIFLEVSSPQSITVGNRGNGGPYPTNATDGASSSIGSLVVASGGGAGGTEARPSPNGPAGGFNGGCGGGGGYPSGQFGQSFLCPDSRPIRFQGFPGGWSFAGHYGGGGGSGEAGNNPIRTMSDNQFGCGGNGAAFPGFPGPGLAPAIPAPVRSDWTTAVTASGYFAGGGAGADQNGGPAQPSSLGGGGASLGPNGTAGVDYTGSGGGGSAQGGAVSAPGGTGIVIVAVET